METKNSHSEFRGRLIKWSAVRVLSALAPILLVAGCESRDVSLQEELAGLREKIRAAQQERDRAVADKTRTEQELARGTLIPAALLRQGLVPALKSLEQNAAAAFPGYRPAPPKAGRLLYIYDESFPYCAVVDLSIAPVSTSALTPEVPKILLEMRAGPDGSWRVPDPPALRELQVAAVARSTPAGDPHPVPPQENRPPQQNGNARVIDWGEKNPAPPKPPQPARRNSEPSGNTPRAAESYEIRFNN